MDKWIIDFIEETKSKIVTPKQEPKKTCMPNYCIDNSFGYCKQNIGWSVVSGWLWNEDSPDILTAHAWVVKRKKHKEITPLSDGRRIYLFNAQITANTILKSDQYEAGLIPAGYIHNSIENTADGPQPFQWRVELD
jgi:hypothetical protein